MTQENKDVMDFLDKKEVVELSKEDIKKVKEKSFRSCEIMNTLDYINIETIDETLADLVKRRIVREYAYIIHDKDKYEEDTKEHKAGELKAPHIHLMLRLYSSYKVRTISKWFGIEPQYVGKIKGAFKDALLYLTHKNAPEKYQYEDELVKSNFNIDAVINNDTDLSNERLVQIQNQIAEGFIKSYNIYDYITVEEHHKFKTAIADAFEYREKKLKKDINRKLDVMYIQGKSGAGKTTLAKKIGEEHGRVFISSGSNDILDGYDGEEVVILDDLRASCIGLSDLLKMLDNNTNSTVKSRYKNKNLYEVKLIIITTVLDINAFYRNIFESEDEPILQFKRRCKTLIRVDQSYIDFYYFNSTDYKHLKRQKNNILEEYKRESEEDALDIYEKYLLGVLGDSEDIKEELKEEQQKRALSFVSSECPF